jgi:carboxyl-terminal processing protease
MGDVGYVRVPAFNKKTASQIAAAVSALRKELGPSLTGYVIDLRGNPGGLLDPAIAVSDLFLDGGAIFTMRGRDRQDNQSYTASPGDIAKGKPLIVLIDHGSAGSSEIVAAALQDHRRATVVGRTSFGRGTVQTIFPLNGGRAGILKLTTAEFFRPDGGAIDAQGVAPDIAVAEHPQAELASNSTVSMAIRALTASGTSHKEAGLLYPDARQAKGDFQLAMAVKHLMRARNGADRSSE